MRYGYARVSTETQDLSGQVERLRDAGCDRIYSEKRSGADAHRPQLQRMLKALRSGDTVMAVVTDRIARDPFDMLDIVRRVTSVGAGLRLLDEPFVDTSSEMSDLVIFVIGWAARWQRKRILENTAYGRARAKAAGVKFGRKPKLSGPERQEALRRRAAGERCRDVARAYRVSLSTIARLNRD